MENKRFELHEGILPQRNTSVHSHQPVLEDFALFDSQCQKINPFGTHSSISSSSIDCAESLVTKTSEVAQRRREVRKTARAVLPASSREEQRRKDDERLVALQTEENVRRKMELLLATALSRKNTQADAKTNATNTCAQNVSNLPTIEMVEI